MKVNAYLTTFQMHEMRGSFLGLDTMNLMDYGSSISFHTYQDEMSCYPIVEAQTLRVLLLNTLLPVSFLHGWLRTIMISHL
jgi:hypothetical protein